MSTKFYLGNDDTPCGVRLYRDEACGVEFRWLLPPVYVLGTCVEHISDAVIRDDEGHVYTGSEFLHMFRGISIEIDHTGELLHPLEQGDPTVGRMPIVGIFT
jgi:hypothetical protein